ncbi:MAG: hypothetical protein JHC95_13185 [Solirubrobacteraceae bacterium]|nr:hypothetical protein [Solirubrobacteraceae bacterium]
MGRRSRTRAAAEPAPKPPKKQPTVPRREGAADRLNPARRTIAAYLGLSALIGVLALLGIATLGGELGPAVHFLLVLSASTAAFRWATARTEGLELTEEDKLMRLLATGILAISVLLALISAVLSVVLD